MKNFFTKLNSKISQLNKLAIFLFIIVYGAILGGVLTIVDTVGKNKDFPRPDSYIPVFPHFSHNEDLGIEYKVMYTYEFEDVETDDDEITRKLSSNIALVRWTYSKDGKTTRRFKVFSKAIFENNEIDYPDLRANSDIYFQQGTSIVNDTPVEYPNHENAEDPNYAIERFNHIIDYEYDGGMKSITVSEEMFTLKRADLKKYADSYRSNNVAIVIDPVLNKEEGRVEFNTFSITLGMRLDIEEGRYHADMQSWLVTDDEKIYPFLGFYSYEGTIRKEMGDETRNFPLELGATHIFIKINFYPDINNPDNFETILYKIPVPTK